ncbi:DUF397 domain-containing protein [Actinomadura sp. LD22]|uniref:DUF397 domain-containing protein n=1 Tax=Actinomadura physcomitrii TaxID=2650748 RepID=A0A6I4MLM5_9ACTN|nr:DUF397 domain-containing protein [Actinomadura physcomitrii]MWA06513.1 DUF397 domain-containing protein [Actinomadura physcomitrii]
MSTPASSPHRWRKSSHSGNGPSCVEVASCTCCQIAVRDSKNPNGPHLTFASTTWTIFIDQIRRGTYDLR